MALGSQRLMLDEPDRLQYFQVRSEIPNGVLLGNIGAQQLGDLDDASILNLVNSVEADGLCIHLNPAQEMAQEYGDRIFTGLLDVIDRANTVLSGRVLVKETGAGLSPKVVTDLVQRGIRYLDISGAGGTSWIRVEGYRAETEDTRAISETFRDWGIPTAAATILARRAVGEVPFIISSGGIRSGLDVAKAIVCGAEMAGLALPLVKPGTGSGDPAVFFQRMIRELKIAMFLTGSGTLTALQKADRVYTGELRDWLGRR